MNWGTRIFLSFVVFAIIIFTMVFISMNQDINLVADDYYKQEIEYEDQIQRIRNTKALIESPVISIDKSTQEVIIQFPGSIAKTVQEGSIHFFRPSDSSLDKRYVLSLDETGIQRISIVGRLKGLWKVKLSWKDQELEYYDEKILTY